MTKTLWVCKDDISAISRADQVLPEGRKRRLEHDGDMVIWPGSPLVGRGFDEIILDDWDPYNAMTGSYTKNQQCREWFDCTVRCRLFPGGRILSLSLWANS